jgi:hypothetical protein
MGIPVITFCRREALNETDGIYENRFRNGQFSSAGAYDPCPRLSQKADEVYSGGS